MTNVYRFTTYSLLFIFACQLITLEVSFHPSVISYGETSTIPTSQQQAKVRHQQPAQLARTADTFDSVVFVGDVLLARNVEFLIRKSTPDYPYQGISFTDFAQRPAVVGNFEAAIPVVHELTKPDQLTFSVPQEIVPAMANAGFTHVSLANNHAYDFGRVGYKNTEAVLYRAGITSFGNPSAVTNSSVTYITVNEQIVAVLAVQLLNRTADVAVIEQLLHQAAQKSDRQIIYVHWGIEYELVSSERQQKIASVLVEAGADLIIGHHPHVVQEVGLIDSTPVFYSLGNYIFDQYFSDAVQTGLLLQLDFSDAPALHLVPVSSAETLSQPTYLTPRKHQAFLKELAAKSAPELRKHILRGVLPLDSLVATLPKIAMID